MLLHKQSFFKSHLARGTPALAPQVTLAQGPPGHVEPGPPGAVEPGPPASAPKPREWSLAEAELPGASERGSRQGGRHAAPLRSLRQIISYLQTLPPQQPPLTSSSQPKRLETAAADGWLPKAARHVGTAAPAGEMPRPRPQKARF